MERLYYLLERHYGLHDSYQLKEIELNETNLKHLLMDCILNDDEETEQELLTQSIKHMPMNEVKHFLEKYELFVFDSEEEREANKNLLIN